MKQLLTTVWWWTRLVILALVGLYALALLWKNSSQRASIWYWPGSPAEETNIMVLALAAFVSGGLMWALASALLTLRRTRAARRKRSLELQREEMERKASMLRVKPAPAPIVRPRVDPKQAAPSNSTLSKPVPTPAVEPTPEGTLAPSPVVVIEPAKRPANEVAPLEKPLTVEKPRPSESAPVVRSVLVETKAAASESASAATTPAVAQTLTDAEIKAKLDETARPDLSGQPSPQAS